METRNLASCLAFSLGVLWEREKGIEASESTTMDGVSKKAVAIAFEHNKALARTYNTQQLKDIFSSMLERPGEHHLTLLFTLSPDERLAPASSSTRRGKRAAAAAAASAAAAGSGDGGALAATPEDGPRTKKAAVTPGGWASALLHGKVSILLCSYFLPFFLDLTS